MTTSDHIRHGDDGFTLVELLVGITISLIVMLATLTSLDAFSSNASRQTRVTDANGQVRTIMDRAVSDLRGASLILTAQATDLAYAVPVSETTARVERLCLSGNELYGDSDVTAPTAPSSACNTGTKIATLKSTQTAFTYDGATSSAAPALVKNVGLTLSLNSSADGTSGSSTLKASAARRSAGTLPITDDDIDTSCDGTTPMLTLATEIAGFDALSVVYAWDGGVSGTIAGGTAWAVPEGVTNLVATVTDAAGVTNIIERDVECDS